jgi:hypothetical protein
MGRFHAIAWALAVGALGFASRVASAQGSSAASPAARRYRPQPLNLHKDQLGSTAYAEAGRSRMRAGDCENALEDFDAALRTSADPTIYRDRGLCHEKLGHPYPAIDDYREYLTDVPDAPDAEPFRQRLAQLEEQVSGDRPALPLNDDTDVPPVDTSVTVSGSVNGNSGAASARTRDRILTPEDEALESSLRRGKGFGLAPFFSLHKWFFDGSSLGDTETWSESVGLQFRYSIGATGAFVLEAGYEHFNSTSADPNVIAGLTSLLAFEFRFPLDRTYDNQVLLAPAVGYERLSFTPSDPTIQSTAVDGVVPRLRFGYRHMLATSTSVDASVDAGFAKWFVPNDPGAPNLSTTFLVAANVAFVWAR